MSTPSSRAEVGFWTVALIARPSFVRSRIANRIASTPREAANANTRDSEKW